MPIERVLQSKKGRLGVRANEDRISEVAIISIDPKNDTKDRVDLSIVDPERAIEGEKLLIDQLPAGEKGRGATAASESREVRHVCVDD